MAKLTELASWRKKQGWSQLDLGAKLRVDQTRVSDWENGRRPIQAETVAALRALGYEGPTVAEDAAPVTREDFEAFMRDHVALLMAELHATRAELRALREELGRKGKL